MHQCLFVHPLRYPWHSQCIRAYQPRQYLQPFYLKAVIIIYPFYKLTTYLFEQGHYQLCNAGSSGLWWPLRYILADRIDEVDANAPICNGHKVSVHSSLGPWTRPPTNCRHFQASSQIAYLRVLGCVWVVGVWLAYIEGALGLVRLWSLRTYSSGTYSRKAFSTAACFRDRMLTIIPLVLWNFNSRG